MWVMMVFVLRDRGSGRLHLGDGCLGYLECRSRCNLGHMGCLLLIRTGGYGCRMSLNTGCRHEVRYLSVTWRTRRGSARVQFYNNISSA